MLILNPEFLKETPPKKAVSAVLLALLWSSLPLLAQLPLGVGAVFLGLLTLRFFLLQAGVNKLPAVVLLALAVGGGLLVWSQLGTVIGRDGGISFLLLMVLLKSFEGSGMRDWQVLLLAMLFLIGSAVLFGQGLTTGLWLLAALLAVGVCFALLCGADAKNALRQGLLAFGLTLPLAAVLFVVMPRRSEPLWAIPQQKEAQAKTGLSDTMQPGSIGNLVQSNELVANVTFSDGLNPRQDQLYWRAIVMADFDGSAWHAMPDFDEVSDPQVSDGRKLSYQMILRDQNGVIPVLDYPVGRVGAGMKVQLGDVVRVRSREGLRRIQLQSRANDRLPQKLKNFEKQIYLRLPPSGNIRTRQLAQLLAQQSGSAREFAKKVLNHYRSQHFSYTLQPPLYGSGGDSIDNFMFNGRQGFCEHYAQSFVVMMRAAGVPARVVTGYLGADYQESGDFWQIRSKNAHAWAEIWLENEQAWLRVDPTAAVSAQRLSGGLDNALPEQEREMIVGSGSGAKIWNKWLESGQFYWQQWVVNYDESSQNNLFGKLGLGRFGPATALFAALIGTAAALIPVVWWWKRGRRKEQEPLTEGFLLLKTAFVGEEDETFPAVTASELLQWMEQNQTADDTVAQLLRQYEDWQFADSRPPSPAEQRAWLAKVRKAVKPYLAK